MFEDENGRRVIRLGDITDHGGNVITGAEMWDVFGRPIARIGDKVICPRCDNQVYEIIEGNQKITAFGRSVAFEGHKTSCGATLISSLGRSFSANTAQNTSNRLNNTPSNSSASNTMQTPFYGNKSNMQTHTDNSRIPRGLYFPKPETTRKPLLVENTKAWLFYAMNAEDSGMLDAYSYLNYARNYLGLDKNDSNLSAAERYAEGYFGNYNKFFIFGQDILKRVREIPLVGPIFGKNGSPVSDSDYVTVWGFLGVEHREAYIEKYGVEPTKLYREMLPK